VHFVLLAFSAVKCIKKIPSDLEFVMLVMLSWARQERKFNVVRIQLNGLDITKSSEAM
jgi:hypothetical protein